MKKVLVIGDTILDNYIFGDVSRINPEAKHSVILDYEYEKLFLGGACNVAANIRSLSKNSNLIIHYVGAISTQIKEMLNGFEVFTGNITHKEENILIKTRLICENHHVLRLDRNKKYFFSESFEENLKERLNDYDYDLIVISDYNKGTINSYISNILCKINVPILFDVKVNFNLPSGYENKEHVILKCNSKEFNDEIEGRHIKGYGCVIETRGKYGFRIHYDTGVFIEGLEPPTVNVVDVVGAGDTFLSGMAVNFLESENPNIMNMANFGNKCASEKVKHFGTYTVKRREVDE